MKLKLGYYSEVEGRRTPREALDCGVLAEKEGFDSVWTGDHFHPWVHTGANASFAWAWFGSLGERTTRVSFGTAVTAPCLRYHPGVVAQAFSTLANMYPGRVFIAVGTGEAMNEIPLGFKWPPFRERAERLEEAISIIRMLWEKEFCSYRGKYYRLNKANLYTKPQHPIPLYVAANGAKVAEMAGRLADGLLTLPFPESHYKEVLFPALEKGARNAGRDPSKVEKLVQLQVSYAEDYDKALKSARWWAPTVMPIFFSAGISDPREIESYGRLIGEEGLLTGWFISTSKDEHIKNIERYIKLGFTNIQFQSSSPDESKFIRDFGREVLPYIRDTYQSR